MSSLFLKRAGDPLADAAVLAEARDAAVAHGFAEPEPFDLPGWTGWFAPRRNGGPAGLLRDGENLVAVAGTITVDGTMGEPALRALLDQPLPAVDWSRIGGHFVALVLKQGRAFLFTDYFAAFPLYACGDDAAFATMLLTAVAACPRLSFHPQGLYEMAFNVTPIGDDTIFNELKLTGAAHVIELTRGGVQRHDSPRPLPLPAAMPLADRLERNRAALEAVIAPYFASFGDRVFCPLSGGLDSRLLLATLRQSGSDPSVYVYGPPSSIDVQVARAIGAAEGFPVDWINKQEGAQDPDAFAAQVERNFWAMDGVPNYGNIFDNGGNVAAQERRHAGAALAASGGCGEIWRDFFFLPDCPTRVSTVADAFFGRFYAPDATDRFDGREYLRNVATKIGAAIGAGPDERVARGRVEHAYPRIRCRALFGREIGMEAAAGAYLMPFLDHRVVAEAMTLPMPLKQAGHFEAALLTAIDPKLARHPSAYGHPFDTGPNRRHRFDEWSTRVRPAWVRRRSYALQRRLRPMSDEHGGLLEGDYMRRVIDPAMPAMRAWFNVDAVTDSGLWRRLACVEYLAGKLSGRLVG